MGLENIARGLEGYNPDEEREIRQLGKFRGIFVDYENPNFGVGNTELVFLGGRFDHSDAIDLVDMMESEINRNGTNKVLVVASNLDYISSPGLFGLVYTNNYLSQRGGGLMIASPSDYLQDIVENLNQEGEGVVGVAPSIEAGLSKLWNIKLKDLQEGIFSFENRELGYKGDVLYPSKILDRMDYSVESFEIDDLSIIRLSGALVDYVGKINDDLKNCMYGMRCESNGTVILDMSRVAMMSEHVAWQIAALKAMVQEDGGELVLANSNTDVLRVFNKLRLLKTASNKPGILRSYSSLELAVSKLKGN